MADLIITGNPPRAGKPKVRRLCDIPPGKTFIAFSQSFFDLGRFFSNVSNSFDKKIFLTPIKQ